MRSFITYLLLFAGLFLSSSASAQPNEAAARALFDEGRALMKEKKYAKACAKFEASQKLGAKASTALNLGVCYDKQGKFATAWSTFGTAATLAKREEHAEREKFAREQQQAMEAKMARLTIELGTSVEGIQVALDGKPVIKAMYGTALPIDPGTHELSATAPGKKPWSKSFEVPAEKADITETIPMMEDDETALAPDPQPAVPVPSPVPSPQPPPDTSSSSGVSPLVYVGFSIGGVGLLVGAITGIVTLAQTSAIKDECNEDVCPASEGENIDDAELVANISNVSFAVAGVGAVLGVVGLFVGGDDSESARIQPILGPGFVGVRGAF
jgi:hypothetical protein